MASSLEFAAVICAIFALFSGAVRGDSATVDYFNASATMVKVGQQVVLHCWGNNVIQSTLHISKMVNATMNTTITSNEDLDSSQSPSVYLVTDESTGTTDTKVKLTILSAKPTDSGTYFCWLSKHANETENITIYVISDPTSVHQFVDNVDTNATGPILVSLTRLHNFTCTSYGSSPPATVSMLIGTTNISSMAKVSSWLMTDQYGVQSYITQLTIAMYQVKFTDFGQQLFCYAGISSPTLVTAADIITPADQSPTFNCSDTAPMTPAQRQAGSLLISCTVFGKPSLTSANFIWTVSKLTYTISGWPLGTTNKGICTSDSTQPNDNSGVVQMSSTSLNVYYMNLTVTNPGKHADAGTEFQFQAINTISQAVHVVKIIGVSGLSAATAVVGSSFPCLLFLAIAVYARHSL